MLSHLVDHGGKLGHGAIVQVGAGLVDVAQAGHLEETLLGNILADSAAAFVGELGPGFDEAELLIQGTADANAVVTGDATSFDEFV